MEYSSKKLAIGSVAPNFILKSKTNKGLEDVVLADTIGRKNIVLLFFPLAFTTICTDEICSVSSDLKLYDALNATVYGISVDSPFAQDAWAKQNNIEIKLLSDFNKTAIQNYGVLCEDLVGLKGLAYRSAFVIDKKGFIAYTFVSPDPQIMPDFHAIRKCIEKLP